MTSDDGGNETVGETRIPPSGPRTIASIGEAIDRYRVKRELGSGGMGIVYEAHDPELRRDVAVKLLRKPDGGDALQARLMREAQAMAQVAHPNVIAVFDVGMWRGGVFIAMELATAGTLRAWCKDKKPREIIDAFLAAGRGLAAAHAVGLVHRDFKPDNVLVGGDGRVRVTDFGLARSHDVATVPERPGQARPSQPLVDLTATGAMIGTPAYMASELFARKPADARTDQFAFCVALWEALYGQRPFGGNNLAEIGEAVAAERIIAPPKTRGVSRAIEGALRRGLAADPRARWDSMDALLAELAPPARRAWIYVAAAALLVIGGGIAIAAVMWPKPRVVAVVQAPADARIDAIDPETAVAMKDLVALDEKITADIKAGKLDEARKLEDLRVERARTSKSRWILADTLIGHAGFVQATDANFPVAEQALREARRIAEAIADDKLKARASIELADVLEREGKREEAADVRALSSATASHTDVDDATRAGSIEAEAQRTDDTEQAIAKWNQALSLREKVGEPVQTAMNRLGLANTLNTVNRLAEARDVLLATLPTVDKLASVEGEMVKFATLSQLGTIENQLERWDDAEAHSRAAIAIAQSGKVPQVAEDGDYTSLGTALLGKRDKKGAEDAFAQALKQQATVPSRHAQQELMIGIAYHQRHDEKTAVVHGAAAVAEIEKALGSDAPDTLTFKLAFCKFLLADGQQARALPIAEDILPKIEKLEMGALAIGDARFALARALPKRDAAHARELANSAQAMLAKAGPVGADHGQQVTDWLAKQ